MTYQEYMTEQNKVEFIYDSDTGRRRLVKGSGEILESIVSRDRQREINRQATIADGISFQKLIIEKAFEKS